MKLLSIVVPCYNSRAYMHSCIQTLLAGGGEVEILIVNDGSTDDTAQIADAMALAHPDVVQVIHQENGGHGDAVMTGLRHATGQYFKVVDSDDWVDVAAYQKILAALRSFAAKSSNIDLLVSNYVYDKVGSKRKHVVRYSNALPEGKPFGWDDVGHFRIGQYILMHATIYRTQLLRDCGLELPKHTFYVDNLYVYVPMLAVKSMYYLNVDFYHYTIGREGQSVNEQVMLSRIDQQIRVNQWMVEKVDLLAVSHLCQYKYMRNYLEIVTAVSSVLLIKSGSPENLEKKENLWAYIEQANPQVHQNLRCRLIGRLLHLPGRSGHRIVTNIYKTSRRVFGFN